MGKKGKKFFQNAVDDVAKIGKELDPANLLTPDLADSIHGTVGEVAGEVTGRNKRLAQEAEDAEIAEQQAAKERSQAEERRLKDEADQRANEERIAAGQRSRTLLTGGQGLSEDDEEATISRRTLSGR